RLRQQVIKLEAQLSAVYASRSWRITQPLRIVSRAVRFQALSRNIRRIIRLAKWLVTGQYGLAYDAVRSYYRNLVQEPKKKQGHAIANDRAQKDEESRVLVHEQGKDTTIGPLLMPEWTEKSRILQALNRMENKPLEELPPEVVE